MNASRPNHPCDRVDPALCCLVLPDRDHLGFEIDRPYLAKRRNKGKGDAPRSEHCREKCLDKNTVLPIMLSEHSMSICSMKQSGTQITDQMAEETPTLRQQQAAARRAQIVETALRLFARQGFDGTSTRQIAQEAGIAEGLIFHYFPTKAQLLTAVLET